MNILGKNVSAGTTARLPCIFGELASGMRVSTDVYVMRGTKPGPIFYLGAGIHGDEVTTTGIVSTVLRRVSTDSLTGTLIVVPVQNPLTFDARHRLPLSALLRSPMDQAPGNVFQCFPGDEDGTLSERMAARLFELMQSSNYVLDIHTPTTGGRYLPFAFVPPRRFGAVSEQASELAGKVGARVILDVEGSNYTSPTTPHVCAAEAGIVGFGIEIGEGGLLNKDDIVAGAAGVMAAFAELGMVDCSLADKANAESVPVHLSGLTKIRASHAGELRMYVELGDRVEKGQKVGDLCDSLGEARETFTSPVSGIFIRQTTFGYVGTGDMVCQLGEC